MEFALTKNQLKILAAIAMFLDHVGYMLFPQITLLRVIGRLSYPIFAFSIYEGCRYTHRKTAYFLQVFGMGLLCVLGNYIYQGIIYGNILITFSLSICVLYSVSFLKTAIKRNNLLCIIRAVLLAAGSIVGAAWVCQIVTVDYGFCGVMVPVFAELFHVEDFHKGALEQKIFPLMGFFVGLLLLSIQIGGIQYYCLLAVFPLMLSGGQRGTYNLKWFFYLFYPVHLLAIAGVSLLI